MQPAPKDYARRARELRPTRSGDYQRHVPWRLAFVHVASSPAASFMRRPDEGVQVRIVMHSGVAGTGARTQCVAVPVRR